MIRLRGFRLAFLWGMAQAVDLRGTLASRRLRSALGSGPDGVRAALGSDWLALRKDMGHAIRWYGRTHAAEGR